MLSADVDGWPLLSAGSQGADPILLANTQLVVGLGAASSR
jgi:hypothetical protein